MPWTPAFHTQTYEEHPVFHDNSACEHGQEVKRDGNAILGEDNRDRCRRCAELNANRE
jgi:hypothetical protein